MHDPLASRNPFLLKKLQVLTAALPLVGASCGTSRGTLEPTDPATIQPTTATTASLRPASASLQPESAPLIEAAVSLMPRGAINHIGFYAPFSTPLSARVPDSITSCPADLSTALFAEFLFGGKKVGIAVLETPSGSDGSPPTATMWLDRDLDGDLSNEVPITLTGQTLPSKGGASKEDPAPFNYTKFMGEGPVFMGPSEVFLRVSLVDQATRSKLGMPDSIDRAADYAVVGTVTLNGSPYSIIVSDPGVTGYFQNADGTINGALQLLLDLNNDGKYIQTAGEVLPIGFAFNIGGTSYDVAEVGPEGKSLSLSLSNASVPERPLIPPLVVGGIAPSFKAVSIDGTEVNFPGDFKGKIVLLVFWAPWCGPCQRENALHKEAYARFHDMGFTIVRIIIDDIKSLEQMRKIISDLGLPGVSILEDQGWRGPIVGLYNVASIPDVILADGSTGEIIALEEALRGPALIPTLEKILPPPEAASR